MHSDISELLPIAARRHLCQLVGLGLVPANLVSFNEKNANHASVSGIFAREDTTQSRLQTTLLMPARNQ
jgi:hypothetical protein